MRSTVLLYQWHLDIFAKLVILPIKIYHDDLIGLHIVKSDCLIFAQSCDCKLRNSSKFYYTSRSKNTGNKNGKI